MCPVVLCDRFKLRRKLLTGTIASIFGVIWFSQMIQWYLSISFYQLFKPKTLISSLSLLKLMSTSYRNGVKAYSMLSGIKSPLLTLADTLITSYCDAMQTQGTWPCLLSSVLWSYQYSELLLIHSLSNIFRRCPAFFYNSKVDFPLWSRLNYTLYLKGKDIMNALLTLIKTLYC